MSESWGNDAGLPPLRHGALPTRQPTSLVSLAIATPIGAAQPRPAVDWTECLVVDSALGNDRHSTCMAIAALRYMQLVRAEVAHDIWVPTEDDVEALYRHWTGDASLSVGTDPNVAFGDLSGRGYKVRGDDQVHIVPRWFGVSGPYPRLDRLRTAIDLCGAAFLTLNLPWAGTSLEAWDVPRAGTRDAEPWGCHEVLCGRYANGDFYVTSWDRKAIQASPAAISAWTLRADALVSRAWLDTTGHTPRGDAWGDVIAALAA